LAGKGNSIAYSTPHVAREYLFAAALGVCHQYVLAFQRLAKADKKRLLEQTREIDLCAKIADFFGPNAYLAAQGTDQIDLKVMGPTLQAEVKYFRPPAQQWANLMDDWNWLLDFTSANSNFDKKAWVVFFPSTSLYKFTNCLSVTRTNGQQFNLSDYAPFSPFVHPVVPQNGVNEQLRFKAPNLTSVIAMHGGKKVRVDTVGMHTHPVWCAIYSRITTATSNLLVNGGAVQIDIPA
jgi:hypothetical protein